MAISLLQFNMQSLLLDTASRERLIDMFFIAFDDTAIETAYTPTVPMPQQYTGISLTVRITFAFETETTATDEAVIGVSWDAMTPGVDTQNLISGSSFDTELIIPIVPAATAGDPTEITLPFTNSQADNVATGDLIQLKLRRVTTNVADTATNDLRMYALEIQE